MSYRRVQKEKKATNCCIRFWSLVMVRNQLPAQVVVNHARREYLAQNCNIFSVLSILRYNPGETDNKFINS